MIFTAELAEISFVFDNKFDITEDISLTLVISDIVNNLVEFKRASRIFLNCIKILKKEF